MNNTTSDLNNLLFEQLERLASAETSEELKNEVDRSKAITQISSQVIENGKLALEAQRLIIDNAGMKDEYKAQLPEFLEAK